MDLIEDNKFQNAFLIYVSIDLFYEKNELENDYDEFKSLVISSGLEIKDCRNFNQKTIQNRAPDLPKSSPNGAKRGPGRPKNRKRT